MSKKFRFSQLLFVLGALLLILSACSGDQSGSGSGDDLEPVTLTMFYNGYSGTLVDDQMEALKEEYPHITIDLIINTPIEEVLTSGTSVDLTAQSMGQVFKVMDLHLAEDLTDLVNKHNFDLNRLAPGVLESAKSYSDGGTLRIMPYELNNSVLLYNKGIFDRFGLEYPQDDLTWDDVTDITRQVTRFEDGVQFSGISYSGLNPVFKNQMKLTFIDDEAGKATINTDGWRHWMTVMSAPYRIEGNGLTGDNPFFVEQTMALRTGPSPLERLPDAIEAGLEWDAVTFPKFPGYEEIGSQMNSPFYTIVPTSQYKDEAFQVIAFLLSDQVQMMNARKGSVPVVDNPDVVAEYGKNLPFLEGTRYAEVIFKEQIAPPAQVSMHDMIGRNSISRALAQVINGQEDINSVLRQFQETADNELAEALKKTN